MTRWSLLRVGDYQPAAKTNGVVPQRAVVWSRLDNREKHVSGIPTTVCHEHKRSQQAVGVRNCLTDEGRPLGIGLQEQVPNHLRRLWPKAMVVNAEGKGPGFSGSGDRQEEDRKGITDEVSKVLRRCPKPQLVVTAGSAPTTPVYGRSGIRHERWPELAMRRLNGTWEPEIPMQTEKPQVEEPRGREYGCGISGAEQPVVAMKSSTKGWSEGAVQRSQIRRSTRKGRSR